MLGAIDAKNDRSPDANSFQPHSDRFTDQMPRTTTWTTTNKPAHRSRGQGWNVDAIGWS